MVDTAATIVFSNAVWAERSEDRHRMTPTRVGACRQTMSLDSTSGPSPSRATQLKGASFNPNAHGAPSKPPFPQWGDCRILQRPLLLISTRRATGGYFYLRRFNFTKDGSFTPTASICGRPPTRLFALATGPPTSSRATLLAWSPGPSGARHQQPSCCSSPGKPRARSGRAHPPPSHAAAQSRS